jgi:mannose-6-phosphate isomerase-like protein (cupin superfamily)
MTMGLIDSRSAKTFAMDQVQFTGLAAPSRGSTENAVWKIAVAPRTVAKGPHQVTREEVFVALSGVAEVLLDGRSLSLEAGSALVVPAHTDFSLSNAGAEPFEAVVVLPVGGQAVIEGQAPFIPPWAQ